MRWSFVALAAAMVLAGCKPAEPTSRPSQDQGLFGAVSMRIHPIFTQVKDVTGSGRPDGVEALLEFQDRFGDPTKASGTVIFELFDYRKGWPDPRGPRLVAPWTGSLETMLEQRTHWDSVSRAYRFLLAYSAIRPDHNYVLTVTFQPPGGRRFFAQTILEGATQEPHVNNPATAPDAGPARRDPAP